METDVIVVGAGLAGLSCAFELAEAGRRPLVLEARPCLGGRTSSWTDPDDMEVESGLHRVPGVYSAFPSLPERAGIVRCREGRRWRRQLASDDPDFGGTDSGTPSETDSGPAPALPGAALFRES